jgi:hypothetical protein
VPRQPIAVWLALLHEREGGRKAERVGERQRGGIGEQANPISAANSQPMTEYLQTRFNFKWFGLKVLGEVF